MKANLIDVAKAFASGDAANYSRFLSEKRGDDAADYSRFLSEKRGDDAANYHSLDEKRCD